MKGNRLTEFHRTRWRNRVLLGVAVVLCALAAMIAPVQAQSLLVDAKGEGTAFLYGGSFAQVNVSDSTIRLGYLRNGGSGKNGKRKPFSGIELSGKPSGDSVLLFQNGTPGSNFQVRASRGWKYWGTHEPDVLELRGTILLNALGKAGIKVRPRSRNAALDALRKDRLCLVDIRDALKSAGTDVDPDQIQAALHKADIEVNQTTPVSLKPGEDFGDYVQNMPYDQVAFQLGYTRAQYQLYSESVPFGQQVYKRDFDGLSGSIVYNLLPSGGHSLWGVAAGLKRSNNFDNLTEVEVRDISTVVDNGIERQVVRVRKARRGDFKESTDFFTNGDYVWWPSRFDSRIAMDIFVRTTPGGVDTHVRAGLGVFLTEKGAPTRAIGGLSVLFGGETKVALFAGIPFGAP